MEERLIPYAAVKRINGSSVLILAPHPDDEVFGCGGAIISHVANGDQVNVVILTNGDYCEETERGRQIQYGLSRQEESRRAAQILGCDPPVFWGLADRGVEYGEFLIGRIEEVLEESGAKLVYAPSVFEAHPDHRALGMAAIEVARRLGPRKLTLAMYEVGVPMPRPNLLLDISIARDRKQKAMECFASQLERQPYDQQVTALNRFRTYTLGTQVTAAEAYFIAQADDLIDKALWVYESEHQRRQRLGFPMMPGDVPLVSILVRSMDRNTLGRALDSVALQTYPNIEVVVVNAAGPSHRFLDNHCGRFPLRLVSSGSALDRSKAANVALENANGKFLVFLDDDDWFEPHHVNRLVQRLMSIPELLVAYADVRVVDPEGALDNHVYKSDFDAIRLMADNYLPIHAVMFDRRLLDLGCRFDESLDVYEDWDFWLQVSKYGIFSHVDGVGACYSAAGNSTVGIYGLDEAKTRARDTLFEKWLTRWSGHQLNALLAYKDSLVVKASRELLPVVEELRERLKGESDLVKVYLDRINEQERAISAMSEQVSSHVVRYAALKQDFDANKTELTTLRARVAEFLSSSSWRVTRPLRWVGSKTRTFRHVVFLCRKYSDSNGGAVVGTFRLLRRVLETFREHGPKGVFFKIRNYARRVSGNRISFDPRHSAAIFGETSQCAVVAHVNSVDIVVCVHNALDDVKRCLESVISHTFPPYSLIIVDDGSDEETRSYVERFAIGQRAKLIRNERANGYTLAANQGMRSSSADYLVLLNSDTVVSSQWLDRMIMCADANPKTGIVGPLSNTASWQSVPDVLIGSDWADNELPDGMSIETMAELVASASVRMYPEIPLLNGFCLLIKRKLIDSIGLFDEKSFAKGYGEENDYCLRARAAGWFLVLADDVYIYHAQSKSYSHERRKLLSEKAGEILAAKHGLPIIEESVVFCSDNRVLLGLRVSIRNLLAGYRPRTDLEKRWEGKRVLFFLNTADRGGGTNVIVSESRALISMGIDVGFVNYTSNRIAFEHSYPNCGIPQVYISNDLELIEIIRDCDAIIATLNTSVEPISAAVKAVAKPPVVGYYIQDFEPDFYRHDSREYKRALQSYGLLEGIVRITKTVWNQRVLKEKTGLDCSVIGASFDSALYRPRPRREPSWPVRPLRIVAMIRPYTPRRAPRLTMEVLRDVYHKYGDRIEIVLFGEETEHPDFQALPLDFQWKNLGKQSDVQLASLFNESDIFVDFSEYQAMGLTAMEAMACGVAVIIPRSGGADSFADHNKNSIFVDSSSHTECVAALSQLIENDTLRSAIQREAIEDVSRFSPKAAAYNLMLAIFPASNYRID